MAIRRIAKRELTRGWLGWLEPYLEKKRQQNMLKQAGARMLKPKLVASWGTWRHSWEEQQHRLKMMTTTRIVGR